ncbi:hypothetical protein EHI8A_057990 [Entamoeba histolytica HM-1:IMSS-B]|uniref:Uncharacterized protein n=5 Tax=Entamoeba histolytica TaxID=5759 RepID=C4LU42_ENTH1|nr:hypothetical protein EHI_068510 [Entamoeba histolytica HM-1:IMSS]EMD47574.1 Hypothetical protein EHI5A_049440 [Entamoeba histolytica KU27]EMH76610.1 hypothetical protein EHI8A_057990 [Entamoeba histolytica HM-1:IMSS-B]ENY63437.1 hypothetical protein EHI7A_056870 [Entamoeba histolytica HM-1:IMSS-A]GAT92112.1 hypothetical protein CL6EHI_068510 [Entamoeba histolytica]EAL48775.1 hypothetical protein EHI_068510 [Entamoeba histolytica HM-1:IMSS]|eukprot:XP_654164.1 hypothetical protein EHI_068510 [Entamoeba histolytica HM-1:IMSS]
MVRKACQKLINENDNKTIIEIYEELISKIQDKEKGQSRKSKCIEENICQTLMKNIQSGDSEVVHSSGKFLRALLTNCHIAQEAAIKAGLGVVVSSQLVKYNDIAEISGVLSGSIWGMANNEDKNGLISKTTVDGLCGCLDNTNIFAVTSAVGALLTLAEDDQFVHLIEKSDIMKKIVKVIQMGEEDETLARLIGGFLCNAAGEKETQVQFNEAGGIEALFKLLEKQENNLTVVARIMSGIRALSNEDEGVLEKLIENSSRFISIGKKHPNEEIIIPMLGIFFNFSQTDSKEVEVHQKCSEIVSNYTNISKEGARLALGYYMNLSTCEEVAEDMAENQKIINEVKKAMDQNEDEDKIISRGCGFLQNISDFEEGRKAILEQGITKNLIEGFKKNREEEEVVKSCLSAITNMSQADELAIEVVKEGGAKEIDHVLDDNKDEELVRLALICVINISSSDNVEEYIDKDWCKHIIEDLDKFKKPIIKEKAITAISGLATMEGLKKELIENDVITALAKYFHVSEVTQIKALNTLFALSSEAEVPKKIVEAHLLSSAAQTINISVCSENFCGLIANCAKDQSIHYELLPFVQDILTIIKSKKTEKAVMFGLNVLINLCSNKETREALRTKEIVNVIVKSISSFKPTKSIVLSGYSALGNASIDEEIKKELDKNLAFETTQQIVKLYKNDDVVLEKVVNFIAAACNHSVENKKLVNEKLGTTLEEMKGFVKNGKTKEIIEKIQKAIKQNS